MAAQTGTRTTFNSTVGLKLDLASSLPYIVSPDDVPMQTRFSKKAPTLPAVLHQWQEDSILTQNDTLGAAMTDTTTASFTATDFTLYKKGYVVKVDSELLRISATPTTSTVAASRGYAGSTAATHLISAPVLIIGQAVSDGADPEQFSTTNRVVKTNYQQVFQEAVTVSDLEEWAQNYGVADKYSYEVMKQLKALAIRLEYSLLFGQPFSDATNNTRTMGGLDSFIVTNATNVAGALTETALNDGIQNCYNNGGSPKTIFISPKQKRKLTGLIAASQRWYPNPDGSVAAGAAVTSYISDFGTLDVTTSRYIAADTLYVTDDDLISIIEGQTFTLENLARTGMATKGEIKGWYSFELKAEKHHAKLYGLT